jgi:D-3-phosphoglycerate dehydrogenase
MEQKGGDVRVLITDHDFPDIEIEKALFRDAGIEVATAQCRTEDDVIAAGSGCAAALVQYAPMNARVFGALPELRLVSRYGAGFDTVNTDDARAHGVWVANSPDYGSADVAAHALAMALALLRHLPLYDRDVRAGTWHFSSTGEIARISGLTLGILGLGRIGKRMAGFARAIFGRVIACDPYISSKDFGDVPQVGRETLFRESDVVSLHVPLNAETRGIADRRMLSLMKPGSFLVNTARGPVADLDAVLAALDSGRLAGAGLDVLPKEPPEADHPVLGHPRVLLSPHAAFYSVEGAKELRTKAALNVIEWARTGRPTYVVVEGRGEGQ